MGEAHLDGGKATSSNALRLAIWFSLLAASVMADACCSAAQKPRQWPSANRESGECRVRPLRFGEPRCVPPARYQPSPVQLASVTRIRLLWPSARFGRHICDPAPVSLEKEV